MCESIHLDSGVLIFAYTALEIHKSVCVTMIRTTLQNTDQFLSDAVHCSSLQSVARMTDERCSAAVSPLSSCCSCSTNLGIPCHQVTHLGGATIITTHQYLNVTNILLNMLPSKRIERGYRCKLIVQAYIQFYSNIVILLSVPVLSCITLRLKTFFKV